MELEDNYYTAISIIEAIGKLKADSGIEAINQWLITHIDEIIKTKQFFVLKHARIAILKLDSTSNQQFITLFDEKYSQYLKDYFIL